ncbi:Alpha/beta hydrolase family protein [Rubripirellula lacrimiformis]|uniref:Alpha/beta hydrolase family protein n=1 Tax=Rubripirellula lacrimiformis TaxID=1930273 RepID=A0A517NGP4_9BACT|nr:alpha/beta hydrolase [Rubripirellula lacrimiformis]QDT06306.1 Alpha/beta hydrolase family protein [Rubripirellula lacrimiformis]
MDHPVLKNAVRIGFAGVLWLAIPLLVASSAAPDWPGQPSQWQGHAKHDFTVDGRPAYVVVPSESVDGNPWVWRARFPTFHAEADQLLLDRGFHIAYINTDGMLGSPAALDHWDAFYDFMVSQHGMSAKPALEAVSRGGLFAYRWASRHPQRVACIYADTPVCDFRSWPLGRATGIGHPATWQSLLTQYGMTQDEAIQFDGNPIDVLAPIAAARIPLLHIISMNDRVVPPTENTLVLADRYRKLGGEIEVIQVDEGTEASNGHHFTHPDPKRVADFIEKHTRR